jgi:c(7)-type cytochrome triheme protein
LLWPELLHRIAVPLRFYRFFFNMPILRLILVLLAAFWLAPAVNTLLLPVAVAAEPQPKSAPLPAVRSAEEVLEQNKFYDRNNPDYQKLQKANESLAGFPLDKRGYVDWMKAIRSGTITPRADLTNSKPMEVLDLDVILKNTREMPYVKFPHNSHTQWLACSNCHDKIFVPKAGANPISMNKIFQGQFCGVCHDRVAFITYFSCERCHSVPHGDTKSWW